jgi:2-polyprenyl-6-methoxyphenol hydroxylase-like FAD-dependent oxidoreductase
VETPVLVVGAGPTGLLTAAELRRRGVAATLIDERDEPQGWDRATIVHPRTLELLASLGLAEELLGIGVHQWGIRIFSDGELLGELDLADSGSRYGFNLNVSEEVTERILAEHLAAQGGEVIRGTRLVGLEQNGDGAVATVEHRGGATEEIRAGWVVGCGGLHSPARELSGIAFEGHEIAEPWAVFDLTLAGWASDPAVNYGFFDQLPVILTPLPGARWRAYMRPAAPDSDLVAEAAATIARYDPGTELVGVENPTRFHCHTKVAARYREGRVLLAGDAAHVCSPSQGHGMNTGLGDAFNLAWKLALVCEGRAEAALLDSYEAERRPVALTVTASGDRAEAAEFFTDAAARAERDRALRELFADPQTSHGEMVAEVELDIDYAGSPIVAGTVGGAGAGDPLAPGARLPAALQEHVRGEHTLLLLAPDAEAVERAARLREELAAGRDNGELFEATVVLGPTELGDSLGAELGLDLATALAVRPDLHVGLRDDSLEAAAIRGYVELIRSAGR